MAEAALVGVLPRARGQFSLLAFSSLLSPSFSRLLAVFPGGEGLATNIVEFQLSVREASDAPSLAAASSEMLPASRVCGLQGRSPNEHNTLNKMCLSRTGGLLHGMPFEGGSGLGSCLSGLEADNGRLLNTCLAGWWFPLGQLWECLPSQRGRVACVRGERAGALA